MDLSIYEAIASEFKLTKLFNYSNAPVNISSRLKAGLSISLVSNALITFLLKRQTHNILYK